MKSNNRTFEKQREALMHIEKIIRAITGDDPDKVFGPNLKPYCSELRQLLHRRGLLLNSMLKETPEVYERMRLVNQHLYNLNHQLQEQMAGICKYYKNGPQPSYFDNYEIVGLLGFGYNDENSILPLSLDADYGSDYSLMMAANESLLRLEKHRTVSLYREIGIKYYCHYNQEKEIVLHDLPLSFDGICICHTTAAMIRDLHYPVFDLLHMNDFWSEVHVTYKRYSKLEQ